MVADWFCAWIEGVVVAWWEGCCVGKRVIVAWVCVGFGAVPDFLVVDAFADRVAEWV